jgi:hypothetical protein
MAKNNSVLKEQYNRLKKVLKQLVQPTKQKVYPQPALQPYRVPSRF